MNKVLKYSLVTVMCLSLLSNLYLLFVIGYLDTEFEHVYTQNDIEWCEVTNSWIGYSNYLLANLQSYSSAYNHLELGNETDCWVD